MTDKLLALSALAIAIAGALRADTPSPGYTECALIEKAIQPGALADSTRGAALEALEKLAAGQRAEISARARRNLGLRDEQLSSRAFDGVEVRVCAIRSLGKSGLPQAVDFLRTLNPPNTRDDQSQVAWSAVQIAIREASLATLKDQESRNRYLEGLLRPSVPGQVVHWAMEELCDGGAQK